MPKDQARVRIRSESKLSKKGKMKPEQTAATLEVEAPPTPIIDLEDDAFHGASLPLTGKSTSFRYDRDLSIALQASLSCFINLDDYDECGSDLQLLESQPENTPFGRRKNRFSNPSKTEPEECSNSRPDPTFACPICAESKPTSSSFTVHGCSHSYCRDCITKYVDSKLDEKTTAISCPEPNCEGKLEPGNCRLILPKQVFDRWGDALAEALVLGLNTLYCPYKNCRGVMVNDGCETVTVPECLECNRLFCVQCSVPWHAGIGCAEFQSLHKDEREREDILLKKLAEGKEWRRCPVCRFYVDKIEGCKYIKCRCGTAFCYRCGNTSMDKYHFCDVCKC